MTARGVHELRLVLTVDDFETALHLYRDGLGLPEVPAVSSPGGRVAILEAGRATLELADEAHAAWIDDVEVGHRTAGEVRVALGVGDLDDVCDRVAATGRARIAPPTLTPFGSRNARFDGVGDVQLTLFASAEDRDAAKGQAVTSRRAAPPVALAIELAQENAAGGELPFAALVLDGDEVLGTGVNCQLGDGDPFAHAEVSALRAAWRAAGPAALNGTLLVSSCEPCALCLSAAATVGVARIAYAATRDDVYGLGAEADPDHETRMRAMADALRAIPTTEVFHVPTADARTPFDTWVRMRSDDR